MPIITYYPMAAQVTAFSTTRHGGVGKGCYSEFNINPYCGDDPQAIIANRKALAAELQVDENHVVMAHQVHGDDCLVVDDDLLRLPEKERLAALEGHDALITNLGMCALACRQPIASPYCSTTLAIMPPPLSMRVGAVRCNASLERRCV